MNLTSAFNPHNSKKSFFQAFKFTEVFEESSLPMSFHSYLFFRALKAYPWEKVTSVVVHILISSILFNSTTRKMNRAHASNLYNSQKKLLRSFQIQQSLPAILHKLVYTYLLLSSFWGCSWKAIALKVIDIIVSPTRSSKLDYLENESCKCFNSQHLQKEAFFKISSNQIFRQFYQCCFPCIYSSSLFEVAHE